MRGRFQGLPSLTLVLSLSTQDIPFRNFPPYEVKLSFPELAVELKRELQDGDENERTENEVRAVSIVFGEEIPHTL